ncbi:Hypothetical protein, putative [Bodo saltans]|uniref:Uncharacterized protein n=1 Tax=Bodo saltans TaxID=75058 RepID=A0A0S4JIK1_BODSA|nr:Hypothetical protein, putative [Bodo saltans]|eukprot:CUG90000.1 Hypothetical protein, putative [Bodo saltans]
MARTRITPKPSEMDVVLSKLAAACGRSPTGLDPNAKFVLCDVCDRLITFVVFRASASAVELCNVCRTELDVIAATRNDSSEPLRITKANGGVVTFAAEDTIQFVDQVPNISAATIKSMKMLAAIDDDEVTPSEGALQRRLSRQSIVRGGRISRSAPPVTASTAAGVQSVKQPAAEATVSQTKRPRANSRKPPVVVSSDEEEAPVRRGRLPAARKSARTESSEQTPENQPARRTLLSRRSSPVMESAVSMKDELTPQPAPPSLEKEVPTRSTVKAKVTQATPNLHDAPCSRVAHRLVMESAVSMKDELTPQPAPPSLEKEMPTRSTVKAKVTQAASAAAASIASKALFADEDDMPFFLSQTTLSAVAEASSHPITASRFIPQANTPQPNPNARAAVSTTPVVPAALDAQSTPVKAPLNVSSQEYEAKVSSGPVVSLFAGIASVVSATETRQASNRPTSLTVEGDGGFSAMVSDGSAVAWRNAFVGVSRHIIMSAVCPTVDAYGVWLSFACGGEQASIDMWHSAATAAGVLETPKRMYSVSLGSGVVVGLSWVPVALAKPDNDSLGICTVLRQKLLLTCKLPRRGVPSATVHVQIAGAQQIRIDSITTNPVSLQWHTSHQSVEDTHLFVAFECLSVAVYQPIGGGPTSKKLNLVLVTTVSPPARRPAPLPTSLAMWWRRTPPVAVGVFPAVANTNTVHLAIGAHDALAVMQGPSFELSNFCKMNAAEDDSRSGPQNIAAIATTNKGFLMATETAVHHYDARRGDYKQMSAVACAAAQIVGLREVSSSLFLCANSAGQIVQAKLRSNGLEMKSVLWVERPSGDAVSLRSAFDGCQPVPHPRSVTSVRYAFHPLSTPHFGSLVLAYYPDGAWVLLPTSKLP